MGNCCVRTRNNNSVSTNQKSTMSHKYSKKLEEKQNSLTKGFMQIESTLKSSTTPKEELTELDINQLELRIRDKSVTPIDLLHAFQARALRIHKEKSNSGICEFIYQAEEQAKQLTDNPMPLTQRSALYGIPISIKELCAVQGYDCTFGLIKRCLMPQSDDSVLIRVLKEAGAIPFVLTATSQLALTTDGFNPVFGNMHNPNSENHEPGGSSSGEAVLIKQNGSPIGIGTDLAGSIRIPSAFCGLVGFKPMAIRVSNVGVIDLNPRMIFPPFRTVAGPIGKSVSDLVRVMQLFFSSRMFKMDPNVPPIPFNQEMYEGTDRKQLVIGYYETFNDPNLIQTVPSVRRAIQRAVQIAERNGHRVIRFDPPRPFAALQLILHTMTPDGGESAKQALDNEPLSEYTRGLRMLAKLPDGFRGLADKTIRSRMGAPAAWAKMVQKLNSWKELTDVLYELSLYREEFEQAMHAAEKIDVLLCPVWAYPAYAKDTPAIYTNPPVLYTVLYNALDFPAGSLPMGSVNNDDIVMAEKWAEERKRVGDKYHERLFSLQKDSLGLPLAVQVVGKPFQDELVLRVMRELEAGLAEEK